MSPSRRTLEWKEVAEYAFLADFDLLRDSRQDSSCRPWATPAARLAMDQYFKVCRAKEELHRLDIEVRRLATYIRDEDRYLALATMRTQVSHPELAHQIALHRRAHGRFYAYHTQRLEEIASLPGFSGSITPGVSILDGPGESASDPDICIPSICRPSLAMHESTYQTEDFDSMRALEEDEEEDEDITAISEGLASLLEVCSDL